MASEHPMKPTRSLPVETAPEVEPRSFGEPREAVEHLRLLYEQSTGFLVDRFRGAVLNGQPTARYRAFYPEIRLTTTTYDLPDSRHAFGYVPQPGTYATTVTRPDLFRHYLEQQIGMLLKNHNQPVTVGYSDTAIPLHFAMAARGDVALTGELSFTLRDVFDVPNLSITNDDIVNGEGVRNADGSVPLAPFTAQRVDYSLARLAHYTATDPEHFQNHVLFTNYQFYVDEFESYARQMLADPASGYTGFVAPGNVRITDPQAPIAALARLPQMPAYHLTRDGGQGITLVNIGVGPSNAKTICDHLAVTRPHAWMMIGHCGGLRPSQSIGDYVLAHAYLRDDHVLDAVLPADIPIPNIAEVQRALYDATKLVSGAPGEEVKKRLRTGTVVTTDDRNWELRYSKSALRFNQSRAVAIDMESATIAAQGYRFRVPYGTLLCVSDKPLHGEIKLPGQANRFYEGSISEHLQIGIHAIDLLRAEGSRLHSRKLRAFDEPPFR